MGILFHRRAEQPSGQPEQAPGDCQNGVCVPDDPRHQYTVLRGQRNDGTTSNANRIGPSDLPIPVPPLDDGRSTSSQMAQRSRSRDVYDYDGSRMNRNIRLENNSSDNNNINVPFNRPHLPPLTLTDLSAPDSAPLPFVRDLNSGAGLGNRFITPPLAAGPSDRYVPPPPVPGPVGEIAEPPRSRQFNRDVPPPPVPGPIESVPPLRAVRGPISRDLYQYDGDRDVPGPPGPRPPLDYVPRDGQRHRVERIPQDQEDHPGSRSRPRQTLREQLHLPERPNPYRQDELRDMDARPPLRHSNEQNNRADQRNPNDRRDVNHQRNPNDHRPDEQRNSNDSRNRSEQRDRSDHTPPPNRRDQSHPPKDRAGDGKVTEINSAQFRDLVKNSDRPVIIDVYTDGCPGCKTLAPTLDKVAAQYNGRADIYKINANQLDPQLRAQLNVRLVPATFMYDQGQLVGKDVGPKHAEFYSAKLDQMISHHRQKDRSEGSSDSNDQRNNRDHESDRGQHKLSARLERVKEKLAKLTHFSPQEKEQAFHPTSDEERTMVLINQQRRRMGLPDVVQDPRLQIIARRHTQYQVSHGMTHQENTPGWQSVAQRMKQVHLDGWRENAASGAFTPETLVQMWMNSPGHRAALLGQGNIAAVAIANGKATFNLTTDPELRRT